MESVKAGTLRSQRKPRHGWFDYEVVDVFGDELGPYGLTVYMVLARLCFGGFRVTMGIRELARYARMSKSEVDRALEKMIEIGLVVEHKGRTSKSVSSYDLTDVKDLVEDMLAREKALASGLQSVPHRDRLLDGTAEGPQDEPDGLTLTNPLESSGDAPTGTQSERDGTEDLEPADLSSGGDSICPLQGQMLAGAFPEADLGDLGEVCPSSGTDLSPSEGFLGTYLTDTASRSNTTAT